MKNLRYYLFILSLSVFITVYGNQPVNKAKKIPAPASKQSLLNNLSKTQTLSNISNRLTSFMKKVGLNPSTAKIHTLNPSLLKTSSLGNAGKNTLPSQLYLNQNTFDKLILDTKYGTPRFIKVHPAQTPKTNVVLSNAGFTSDAMSFLTANKSLLKISDPQNEFKLKSIHSDRLGMTHVRLEQTYKGLEVWGKDLYVHLDKYGNVLSMDGRFAPTPSSIQDITPQVVSSAAVQTAVTDLKSRTAYITLSGQFEKLLDYYGPSTREIIWYNKQQQPHLAWFIEVRSGLLQDWYYFIDANTGAIINSYNNVCYDGPSSASGTDLNGDNQSFGTYQVGSNYYMIDASQPMFNSSQSQIPGNPVGAIVCLDLKNTDLSSSSQFYYVTSAANQWNDPASVSANYNAITTYQYYRTIQNRKSIDNNGMSIYSIIHVTQNGSGMDNAYWNGKVMCYGDGNTYFKPLAGGLDVAAHEMTHGVTQYTSNLEYQDQSGALNESMSDVFGKLVDTTSWKIGATVVKDFVNFPSGALRDMSNPHNGGNQYDICWQPDNMSEYVNTTEDNGGVHVNSGIPNYVFYLVASVTGRSDAGKIWYRAETTYLTHSSQFLDARIATEQAATDLFGSSSSQLSAVKSAWDNVGVLENTPPPPPPSSQLVGQNWILAVNTSSTDPNSIYITNPNTSPVQYSALTTTPVLTKPAVSDTSGLILFVGQDYELRAIYADPSNPQETVLDTDKVWWSVAVGPGLNSIALTSKYIDTTIYYIDVANNINKTYKIITPTYDATDTVNTALYADALSFDPTGTYLIFDTFNQIIGVSDTLSYWNINLLDIQTGMEETIFPALAQGENVDDPSFSKTSQTRFAFDYENKNTGKFQVMAADFNTGKTGVIDNTVSDLGYPSYSGDDKNIVYHNYSNTQHVVNIMPLNSDLISSTGTSQSYLSDATYPVWFVIGNRVTAVQNEPDNVPQTTLLEQNYPNPFNPATEINYQLSSSGYVTLKVYDILGKEVKSLVDGYKHQGSYSVNFNAGGLASGIYFYQLRSGSFVSTKKLILMK